VDATDLVGGVIGGRLSGDPADLAWIVEMLLDGQLDGNRAMRVEARHVRDQ
jgi:hypothetical protein